MKRKGYVIITIFLAIAQLGTGCGTKRSIVGEEPIRDGDIVKMIEVDLTTESYGIGVAKDNPEMLSIVNDFVHECRGDGTITEILSHYRQGGKPQAIQSAKRNKEKDQLIVASTLDFEPFEYDIDGEYYGIDFELAQALAKKLGKELVLEIMGFEEMFLSVRQHKTDICIAGITITPERKKLVDFSEPYYVSSQKIAVLADNTEFDKAKDAKAIEKILREKDTSIVIGVENLTTAQEYCEGNESYAGFPVTVKGYRDVEAAVTALAEGDCQYVVGDEDALRKFVEKENEKKIQ